jgi:DNA modification methylase
MNVQLHLGDCLEVLAGLPENSVDTCITDPPYELGFMGKKWDSSGIAFQPETWQAVFRVLKPGAIMLAFGGTRTYHRMVCAIEDAGFEIRDTIAWVYGSGFPKSYDISKGIDKDAPRIGMFKDFAIHFAKQRKDSGKSQKELAALFPSKTGGLTGCVWNWENGASVPTQEQWRILQPILSLSDEWLPLIERIEAEREVIGMDKKAELKNHVFFGSMDTANKSGRAFGYGEWDITAPSTPEAQLWHGWGTALKPAFEPIVVAMKPIDGTFVNNALTWGVAGLWIDGGRVEYSGEQDKLEGQSARKSLTKDTMFPIGGYDRSERSQLTGRFPANLIHDGSDEVVGLFPDTKVGARRAGQLRHTKDGDINFTGDTFTLHEYPANEGSAARFFYCAKASRSERNAGLEGMEERPAFDNPDGTMGGNMGSLSKPRANHHPTVKPIELMRYLVRLTKTPTGGVVLDPFMGSGTTGVACVQTGRNFIGIEIDPTYFAIAERRIQEAQLQPRLPLEEAPKESEE